MGKEIKKCDMCGSHDTGRRADERLFSFGDYTYCAFCIGKILHHIAEQIGNVIKRGGNV